MQHRYTPRINITLPPQLLADIKRYEEAYNWKRSSIIRNALSQWLAKQPPIESKKPVKKIASKTVYDPERSYMSYFTPNMSDDEKVDLLLEYEAATIPWLRSNSKWITKNKLCEPNSSN